MTVGRLWECNTCQLHNFDVASKCQACFTSKFNTKFDLQTRYHTLSDKDLSEIILKCDKLELKHIFDSLEYHNAIYRNHSFLSLLIDIGKINLIFLLFKNGFQFPLNYGPESTHNYKYIDDDAKEISPSADSQIYVESDKILPLSMAFERDEIYLIKLLLRKGADPNQCTKPENLGLHYEWFDLSRHEVYLHYLPISIPVRKTTEQTNDVQLAEYKEIFDMLIHFGALWFEDGFMFLFCNKDASFWIDFLSSYRYRKERYFIHNAMKKYYRNTIKPLIQKSPLRVVESVFKEYFVSFPMIDIPNNENIDDSSDETIDNNHNIYAKILSIQPMNEENKDRVLLCQQYEYTIVGENDVITKLLVHDERIWKELNVNDVIHITNAMYCEQSSEEAQWTVNYDPQCKKIVHHMTLTPSITVISDERIRDKFFQNTY